MYILHIVKTPPSTHTHIVDILHIVKAHTLCTYYIIVRTPHIVGMLHIVRTHTLWTYYI